VSDFADNLDLKASLCGSDDDTFEEATENLNCLIPNLRIAQGMLEPLDLSAVNLRQVWMQADGRRRCRSDLLLKLRPPEQLPQVSMTLP